MPGPEVHKEIQRVIDARTSKPEIPAPLAPPAATAGAPLVQPPPPPNLRGWAAVITAFAALLSAASFFVVQVITAWRQPAEDPKSAKAYEKISSEVVKISDEQRKQAEHLIEMRAWWRGYFQATGVRVVDPPNQPVPVPTTTTSTVELLPAPLPKKTSAGKAAAAPPIQVRNPLPAPPPVPPKLDLPKKM